MQAGITGVNTIRIYNPVKQAEDHDPRGHFVRRWVPELAPLSTADLLRPWDTPLLMQQMHGVAIGRDYPRPLVDHESSYARARTILHNVKREAERTGVSNAVWRKHGSRRLPLDAPNR
jgi:deoxyribodipyrimidine photo-lyase